MKGLDENMIENASFIKDRKQIESVMKEKHFESENISVVPLSKYIYAKTDVDIYQIIGVTSGFVKGEYVEIFVTIDLKQTLKEFDGKAVKTFYFNSQTVETLTEISEIDIRSTYQRSEWRRLQKYIGKEKMNILKEEFRLTT